MPFGIRPLKSGLTVIVSCVQVVPLSVLRHCFAKRIRVMVMTLDPNGAALSEAALSEVAPEYGAVYGRDYVFLGFKPGYAAVIMALGENVRQAFPADYSGKPISDIPMMVPLQCWMEIASGRASSMRYFITSGSRNALSNISVPLST